jgi:site-specific DNA-methyltransferase (adenine-specific)
MPLLMDDIISNKLEVKPPKVSMSKLIDLSLIKVGETLYDKKGDPICEVCEDGRVLNGVGPFSIHKMSAIRLGLSNNNG